MAVLHCISKSELCNAINSAVATVHLTALNWNNKIWQDATYAIHCMKQTENMKT